MGYERTKQSQFQQAWTDKRREAWIASQGGRCVECGATEALEVDHIDPRAKTLPPSGIWSRGAEARAAELELCQVLCYHCHKAKTRTEQWKVSHGDYGMYNKHGCRCPLCREANAARARRHRARR